MAKLTVFNFIAWRLVIAAPDKICWYAWQQQLVDIGRGF